MILIRLVLHRYQPVSSLTVVTLFPEPEMKRPRGEAYTKAPYRLRRSPIASAATCKRTLSTPACGRLGLAPLLVGGIVKRSWQSMAKSARDRNRAPVVRLKVPGPVAPAYT